MTTPDAPPSGLLNSLRAFCQTGVALAQDRLELIIVEFSEERERTRQRLTLTVVAIVFLSMGMLLLAAFVVLLFWDLHRLLAASGMTLLYLVIGAAALARIRSVNRDAAPPFAATLREFQRDLNLMRDRNE
jgi:uncharacterized membrane protein YqjE